MTHKNLLKILFVEDLPSDVDLAVLELRKEGLRFEHIRVDTGDEFIQSLNLFVPNIIISDYMMPSYNGMQALKDAHEYDPLIPFILCTGSMNEETAVECLKAGATDYIIKEHITRLPFAVKEALDQYRIKIEKRAAELLLKENEEKLQSIFSASPVGIGLFVDRVFMEVNDTFCKMTGYSRKELIGKNSEMVYASGENYENKGIEKYRQIAQKGTGSVETRFKCKDGRILNIFLSSTPLDKDDQTKGVTFTVMDITERKRAEEALVESETKYRQLVTQSPDGIFIADLSGKFLSVNRSLCDSLKYTENELLSMKLLDIVPEQSHSIHKQRLMAIMTGESTNVDAEYEVKGKDGTGHFIQVLSVPYYMGKEIVGFQGIARDITERKKEEEVLRESESSLRNAQEIAKMGSWEWDMVTQKTNWSDNYFAIHGFKRTEVEPGFEFFRNRIHPDDVHFLDETHANIMKDKTPSSFELRLIQPDGTVKWIQNNISPVIEDDKLVKLKGVIIDITERKQADEALRESEVRYKTLFSNAAEGILAVQIKTMKFLYANPALCKMFGYNEEEIIHLGVKDLHRKESLNYVMAEFGMLMRDEKTLASDIPCLRKDGTLFHADIRSTSMVLDGFKCLVGFFIDITDQLQAQRELLKHRDHLEELVNERTEELSKAKKEAEEANKAKSEFLANMSHEIRTPMNAVLGYTELLGSTPVDQTQKEYINSIKSSGRSLLTLINDILDLSKIEAGKLEMEYEYVDTYSFFSEFERIFSLKVSEKGLKFILDITSGTPAGINIDEARVRQIVFNLIGNAIKFTSEGKIVLKVFTENPQIVNYSKEKSEELIDLIIEVQDTGIGISTELQEAIFEPFVQERDNKHHGGTGLGLTITRRLTALMDGTIQVQSKPGEGKYIYCQDSGDSIFKGFLQNNRRYSD